MCIWPACERTDRGGLGFCMKHYARYRRGVTPPVAPQPIVVRTLDHLRARCITSPDGCWIFTGSLDRHGYGRVGAKGIQTTTHRFAYEQTNGPVPEGLDLDHLCRVRACCNPAHLEPVTRTENLRRGAAARPTPTVCAHGHDLTDPANLEMRRDGNYLDGLPRYKRRCIPCRRARQHIYNQQRRAARAGT